MASGTPTREILWNVGSDLNNAFMYGLLVVALVVFAAGVLSHVELWMAGQPAKERLGNLARRFFDLFRWGLLQKGVVRERLPAVAHSLIYIGFLVLTFTTTMVMIDHDFGIRIYQGDFYLAVTLMSDLFGLGVLIGCAISAHRRYMRHEDKLHNRLADYRMLAILSLLIVQGFALEGLRIHVTKDPWAAYSPVGNLVAQFAWPLSERSAELLHFGMWWFHTLTVYAVIAVLPYTKFFHILASPANLYFRDTPRPAGSLEFPGDLEQMMESGDDFNIGLGTIKDYSWKHLLDLDACTSCGRCQDACPAYLSGKPLSPKWVILDTRNHALALKAKGALPSVLPKPLASLDSKLSLDFLSKAGLRDEGGGDFRADGAYRAENLLVQGAVRSLGGDIDARISGDVMDPDVFWSCTSCMACVEACPVGINHVDQIMGNRRNMALMHGELPAEVQPTLRGLENRANPYGPQEDRIKWLTDLEVKILQPGDSVDYLYWVGCVSAFDPRKQKIARALVSVMKRAGLSFGILGTAEGCTGDPARRLGEENLFQTLAKTNIATLNSIRFKVMVANCPHCFNTIRNEYPQFGNLGDGEQPEIIHHSVLLKRLIDQGRISLAEGNETFTFHDPCYLGRYNKTYDAPRDSLRAVKGLRILEMDRSKEKGMCCGAGGGHFWMDMKVGERVNVIRTDQAAATGASNIATACPFCMQMMEDGIKLTNREDAMQVRDIAEVVAEKMV